MKKFNLLILLTIVLSYFPYESIYSQFVWEQLPGLGGGYVEVLASNSTGEIFAGTSTSGIFKSTDNGNSWIEKNNGLTTNNVISLAINNNDDIFAGTFNAGIFRSTDNGESWAQINNGLTMTNIRSIIFNDSSQVFVCSGGTPFQGGVFRSTNNGDSWTPVNSGLPFGAIFSLALDSSNTIYAGSGFNGGIRYSTNNGENWLPTGMTTNSALSLTVDKTNNIIYMGTYTEVLKSTDSGQSWGSTGLSGNIWALSTVNTGEVFAGTWAGSIYRSSDNGTNWINLVNELTIVQDIMITQNGNLYVATAGPGVFYSSDNGNNWENRSEGLGFLNVNSINIAPNGNIFAGAGMVYRSLDGGESWAFVKGGRGNSWYNSIVANSQGIIFAANAGFSGGYWIYRSTDNGDSWVKINNGITDSTIWTIALDSMDNIFIGTNGGIFKSTNDGDTWIPSNSGLTSTNVRALILKNNNTLFAGTHPSGLFRSTDGGNNWVSILNGIIGSSWLSFTIDSVGNIYTGSADGGSGIYKSTNNGDSWVKADSGITDLNIFTLTAKGNDIFAGTQTGGVFHSTNNGQYWTDMNEGFQTISTINYLYIKNNYIYAGTNGLWHCKLFETTPLAPTNLAAIADTFSVDLFWDDNSNNEDGFKIERKDDSLHLPGTWALIDSLGENVTAYTDTGLTPNTTYSYRVSAYNEFGISIGDSVEVETIVPIELTSFTATVIENSVTLNWTTATELNNQGFEVERKFSDGQFAKVGYVQGNGTTTEKIDYSFTDANVEAGNYSYRLKQVDFDGTFEYSNTIEVEVLGIREFALSQNYPNPFNPSTSISYSIPENTFVTMKVYDIIGTEVAILINQTQEAGKYDFRFDASNLSNGIYFYQLTAGNFTSTKKMILLK